MYEYNGFGKAVQDRSTTWMFAQMRAGILPNFPKACECCGQTNGKIGYHAESYAVPFGAHIVAFDVCHLCHVMIHADRNMCGTRLREYAAALLEGYRFQNFNTFDWKGAKAKYLHSAALPAPEPRDEREGAAHDPGLIHNIFSGTYNPQLGFDKFWAPIAKTELFK